MHPRAPRELADGISMPFSSILEKPWQSSEVPRKWKKGNIAPIFEKGRKEGWGATDQ